MRTLPALILSFALIIVFTIPLMAVDAQYVGANKCKVCHISKKKGAQYKIWQNSAHSKAYATLGTDKAKEVAKKAGVSGDPQKADQCLKCHVTGYEAPAAAKAASFKVEEGVGCESCHGPGSLYKAMKVMKALRAGTQDPKAVQLVKPSKEDCLTCHNEKSPFFKPFNFEERFKIIAHPVPAPY